MTFIPWGATAQTTQAAPAQTQSVGFTPDLRNYQQQQRQNQRMMRQEKNRTPDGYENIYGAAMNQYMTNQMPQGGWTDPNAQMQSMNDFRGQYANPNGKQWTPDQGLLGLAQQNYASQWNGQPVGQGKNAMNFADANQYGQYMVNNNLGFGNTRKPWGGRW